MINIEASMLELVSQRVIRPFPFPVANQAHQPAERVRLKAESLAYLARRGASAVRNHIGCHCSAEFPVSFIDVLDSLLSLIPRRKIKIYVRPLSSTLTQEPLKQQLHSNGIDRRNFKCVTDRGIRRTSSSLHQDVVLLAVADNIPDNKKVSGKAQLLYQ